MIVVAHGGVTVDALRTLFGDRFIQNVAPRAITEGVPCGAITSLRWDTDRWTLERFGDDRHLQHDTKSTHRPA